MNCLKQLFFCILAVFCLKNCFCCEVAPERIEISLASRFEKVKTGSVLTRFLDMPFLEEEETKKIIVPPVCLCEPGTRVKINVYSMLYHKHSVDESLDFTRQIVSIINLELPELEIEIDGGVNAENAVELRNAGADILVAGSFIFGSNNFKPK